MLVKLQLEKARRPGNLDNGAYPCLDTAASISAKWKQKDNF